MYWLRRRLLSQNFLSNRELISRLIRDSSISASDTILEIGSGRGIITRELAKVAQNVIAVEIDPRLATQLKRMEKVEVVCKNILDVPLPRIPYKVFSNIPFSITGDIIRKLLQAANPPNDCYLIVQSEAASKFIMNSQTNTMAAVLYYPWWEIQIAYKFNRTDFEPNPKVNSVLLHAKPKLKPFVPVLQKTAYYDFIAYDFVHNPQAKLIPASQWLSCFKDKRLNTTGAYTKLLREQSRLQKIHRTRASNDWKKFK